MTRLLKCFARSCRPGGGVLLRAHLFLIRFSRAGLRAHILELASGADRGGCAPLTRIAWVFGRRSSATAPPLGPGSRTYTYIYISLSLPKALFCPFTMASEGSQTNAMGQTDVFAEILVTGFGGAGVFFGCPSKEQKR